MIYKDFDLCMSLAHRGHFGIALSYEYMLMNLHFTTVRTMIAKQNYPGSCRDALKPDMRKDSFSHTQLAMPQTAKLPRAIVVWDQQGCWVGFEEDCSS